MTLYIPAGRPQGSPPRSTPPPPLQLDLAGDASFVFIVRAGAVWSGVGTLAVALAAPCSLWTFKLPQVGFVPPRRSEGIHVTMLATGFLITHKH